jgi:hypothetical protein
MAMNSHIQNGATSVLPCVASTAGISATEKFDFWHDVVSRNLVDLDYSLVDRTPFEAMFSGATVDAINVSKIKATAHRVSRSAATISRLGTEAMVFNFVLSGRMIAEQDGRTATIGVGEGVVCDARRAYSLHFDQPFEIACVRLPHQALSHEVAGLQRITATNFNSTTQLCPLVFSYLSELLRRTDSISDGSSRRIFQQFYRACRGDAGRSYPGLARADIRLSKPGADQDQGFRGTKPGRFRPRSLRGRRSPEIFSPLHQSASRNRRHVAIPLHLAAEARNGGERP